MSTRQYKSKFKNYIFTADIDDKYRSLVKPPHDHAQFLNGLSAVNKATMCIEKIESETTQYVESQYFRIPTLIQTKHGTLVASYDIRWDSASDIGMTTYYNQCCGTSRSTDGGVSWEDPICTTVWLYTDNELCSQSGASDPSLAYDYDNDCIFQFSICGLGLSDKKSKSDVSLTSAQRQQFAMSYSTDDGKNWSEGESILSCIDNAEDIIVGKYANIFSGCSQGIILKHQTGDYASENGSIILPIQIWKQNSSESSARSLLMSIKPTYSYDNYGNKTVQFSGKILTGEIGSTVGGSSECTVCEDESGNLIIVVKSYSSIKFADVDYPSKTNSSYLRLFKSTDCGNSWNCLGDITSSTDNSVCSSTRDTAKCKPGICYSEYTKNYYISYQQSPGTRKSSTIRYSSDLINWKIFDSVSLQSSGYSSLLMSNDQHHLYYIGEAAGIKNTKYFDFIDYNLYNGKLNTYSNGNNELITNVDTTMAISGGDYVEKDSPNNNANGISAITFYPSAFTKQSSFIMKNFLIRTSSSSGHPTEKIKFQLAIKTDGMHLTPSSIGEKQSNYISISSTSVPEIESENDDVYDLEHSSLFYGSETQQDCDTTDEYNNFTLQTSYDNINSDNVDKNSNSLFKVDNANSNEYEILTETIESAYMNVKDSYVFYTLSNQVELNSSKEYKLIACRVSSENPYDGVALRLIKDESPSASAYYAFHNSTGYYKPVMAINIDSYSSNSYSYNVQGFDFKINTFTDKNSILIKSISHETGNSSFSNVFLMIYTAKIVDSETVYELVSNGTSNKTSASANDFAEYTFDHQVLLKKDVKYYVVSCSGNNSRSLKNYGPTGNYISMTFSECECDEDSEIDVHYGDGTESILVPNGVFSGNKLLPRIYITEYNTPNKKIGILLSRKTKKPALLISKTSKKPAWISI